MPEQVVKQRARGFICVNAHPGGCVRNVERQIAHVQSNMRSTTSLGLRNVLVIGASTGYGLATCIAAGWGLGCRTLGVFLEKPPAGRRTASAGYYNCVALQQAAERSGLWVRSINGDAYSDQIKQQVAQTVAESMGKLDLIVYSLAAPKRTNPRTGVAYASRLKSIGSPFTGKTIDLGNGSVSLASVAAATDAEIDETIAVMGGEDWRWWIECLSDQGLLGQGVKTIAYSYIGPEVTWPIYRDGTIGAAKRDLKATADTLNRKLAQSLGGSAWLAVNKAVVTQASAAIPVVPLYVSLLFRVMKAKGIHEGCIEQMTRLVRDHLAGSDGPHSDAAGLIRLDDLEMRADVQREVADLWPNVTTENLAEVADFVGFRRDFNNLFGFDVDGINYDLPVETEIYLS